jgi:Ricin-type beta-trefoil lectin domain-like
MGRFVSNRNDVENGIRQGGWVVAFSQRELTETDALGALIATGVAIYTDQPEIIFAYLDELLDESIHGLEAAIQQTITAEVQTQIQNFAIPIIKGLLNGRSPGESQETLGHFGVKAGLAKFIGHNEEWNPVANPGGILSGDTGAWQQVGPGLVSYCPYVGIRYLQTPSGSGGGGGVGPSTAASYIVNDYTGKYLDLAAIQGNPDDAPVRGWSYNGQTNQQWVFEQVGEGEYRIRNLWSGKYLDNALVQGNPNGSKIHIWHNNGQANQIWIFELLVNSRFRLRNKGTGKYLDMAIVQGNPNGEVVHGWELNNQTNQVWKKI